MKIPFDLFPSPFLHMTQPGDGFPERVLIYLRTTLAPLLLLLLQSTMSCLESRAEQESGMDGSNIP